VTHRPVTLLALVITTLVALGTDADPAVAQTEERLQQKVDVLAEEVARLRELLEVPATEEQRLEGKHGMSPVAAKVYAGDPGLSIGGYGEFYYAAALGDDGRNTADFYRFIAYLGYKFSDRVVMNTELEFEHATTAANWDGDAGSVSVEFAYLDFLLSEEFNVRAGNLLVPMGFINTLHEPVFYRGNFRPELERRIIPSTWREIGAGAHGSFGDGVRYTAYVVNGLDGADFDARGVRGGRQKGNRVAFEDVGLVAAVDWDHGGKLRLGGSAYHGGADHDGMTDPALAGLDVSHWILEAHAQYRHRGLEARAMIAAAGIDGAGDLTQAIFPDAGGALIPEAQDGWYVDVAYDVAPLLFGPETSFSLSPWLRYEDLRLQSEVPELAGRSADPTLDQQLLTIGLEGRPHPQVVVKLDYVLTDTAADTDPDDQMRVGAGYAF
jgi:hypothetical protein